MIKFFLIVILSSVAFAQPTSSSYKKATVGDRLFHWKKPLLVQSAVQATSTSPTSPTPTGVVVTMSDGTTKTYTLGSWLAFTSTTLRAVMPVQYVNQIAVSQTNGTWTFQKGCRNLQVWRNGLLQRLGADYTVDLANGILTPIQLPDPVDGALVGWSSTEYVTLSYLF